MLNNVNEMLPESASFISYCDLAGIERKLQGV
jgi:hypothetical protein